MNRGRFSGNEKNRAQTLSAFYERRLNLLSGIPQIGLEPLNRILGELFETGNMPRHNLVLLKANYALTILAQKRVSSSGRYLYEYSLRFLGRLYPLLYGQTGSHKLIHLKLDVRSLYFSWEGQFRRVSKQFELPEVLTCADLTAAKFKTATGMGVKKVATQGVFKIGGRLIKLGKLYEEKIVLVFFDRGNLFVFELNGKRINIIGSR